MIYRFYPKKDSTIYERYTSKNTGLDAVLELTKNVVNSSSFNTRILVDFDYTAISQSIVAAGYNPNLFDWKFKLFAAEAREIPLEYTMYCYAVSQSWGMGIGRYANQPETTVGVSWKYRVSANDSTTQWSTASLASGTTASWSENAGGGTWYTGSAASQSFSYTTTDINFDVNEIIRQVQSGSFAFSGFLVKRSDADESSLAPFGSVKFFSKDSHTIYFPVLEGSYDDSIQTGSLSEINTDEDFNITAVNLQQDYKELSTPTFRFAARPRFPVPTFSTSSVFLTRYKLPANSQYAIYSAKTDDVVIGFGNATKLSSDSNGNYFKLSLDSFQPERYYKIVLRVPYSGSTNYQIYDKNWIFKVSRNQ